MSLVVAVPQLPSGNLDQTEIFFHQFLGFETVVKLQEHGFLSVQREGVEIHFWLTPSESVAVDIGKMSSCYIRVEGIDSLYKDLEARQTQFRVPLSDMPWGMREFQVDDPFFNAIKFGEKL